MPGGGGHACAVRMIEMSLGSQAAADQTVEQERALSGWDFIRHQHYHSMPLFGGDELHDPVKYFNMYGTGFCDDAGNSFASLAFHGGLGDGEATGHPPKNRELHGHVQVGGAVTVVTSCIPWACSMGTFHGTSRFLPA